LNARKLRYKTDIRARGIVKFKSELGALKKGKTPTPGSISSKLEDNMRINSVADSGKISFVVSLFPVTESKKLKRVSNMVSQKFWDFSGTILAFLKEAAKRIERNVTRITPNKKVLVTGKPKTSNISSPEIVISGKCIKRRTQKDILSCFNELVN
jgi:hypothetical protein